MAKKYIKITSEPEMRAGKKEWTFRFLIPAHGNNRAKWDKWQKSGTKKKSEARRSAEEYRHELEERINSWENWKRITLGQYARNWHDERRNTVAAGTWKKEEQAIKQIEASELGGIDIDEIQPEDIERQIKENRRAGFSEDKNRRYIAKVKSIMKEAAARRRIRWDASAPVKNIKESKTERIAVSHQDAVRMMKILEEGEQTNYTTALYVILCSGLRRGEALGLQWGDIDFKKDTIHLRRQWTAQKEIRAPKWDSKRDIPMTLEVKRWLKKWLKETAAKDNPRGIWAEYEKIHQIPVLMTKTGGHVDPNHFDRWMRKNSERHHWGYIDGTTGEWKRYTAHQIRHYTATQLLALGADLQTVKSIMGHKSLRTTERYLHAIDENLRQAVRKISATQGERKVGYWDEVNLR